MTRAGTLGELRASGWESRPVKDEVRANALARIAAGKPLVDGVIGFDDTVLPQLENALLAGHDVIFLGERGQAKTRIIRSLVSLLDEWTPTIAGSEINDDPYAPVAPQARRRVAERGRTPRSVGAPRAAVQRSHPTRRRRPDRRSRPIWSRRGPYLADELTSTTGSSRTNNGIFAINGSPTSPSASGRPAGRARGSDVNPGLQDPAAARVLMLVASATGLHEPAASSRRSRTASAPRSHPLPLDVDVEMDRSRRRHNRSPPSSSRARARVRGRDRLESRSRPAAREHQPALRRVGASLDHEPRRSSPARASCVAQRRDGVAPGQRPRRARRLDRRQDRVQTSTTPRAGAPSASSGIGARVFGRTRPERLKRLVAAFDEGVTVHTGEDVAASEYAGLLPKLDGLRDALADLGVGETPAGVASAVEFVLEGLHLSKRLNKDAVGGKATYRGRG